jgi:pimeloyl-ACP methyl ester carboxylesterase
MMPRETHIPAAGESLIATISGPESPLGTIVFAHGSGSSRHSPRNRAVAERLNHARFQTVLLDLLTSEEEGLDVQTARLRFNIELLAERLVSVCDWLGAGQPVGLFGASTGAAAALRAAAERAEVVRAVVSRGGRPDLAGASLSEVKAPTLLIVGGDDEPVIELNLAAARVLGQLARVAIVPGASHLFVEPGALEQVADLAVGWFDRYLGSAGP